MIAPDVQKVIDAHQHKIKLGLAKKATEAVTVPAIAKATGLTCERVNAVYGAIREIYGPYHKKILVPDRVSGGHVLYGHFDRRMFRRFMREQRTRTQYVETMARRTAKSYDTAATLALMAGKTAEFAMLTGFAASHTVIANQATTDKASLETLLPTL